MPALYPGQYLLTKEQFPELSMLHPRLLDTPPRPMCLGQYWIAYVRAGSVLAVDCIKSQPVSVIVTIISDVCYHTAALRQVWMSEMKEYISSIPLHALMLPGSHNAGSWDKFESYTDDTVLMRYSVNQGEDIWTQLLLGIRWLSAWYIFISLEKPHSRYLDLRVSYYNDTPEKFWLVHDFVKQNPLYEAVHAVKRFLRMTKELVILDFQRFPFGFKGENTAGRHDELVNYINQELGEFMAPDWLGKAATMNDLWHLNRTLIVTYQDDTTENKYDNLWSEALHAWADTKPPANLFRYLNQTMQSKQSATYLWVAMTHLTPSAMDVVWNLASGLRHMNDKISK